MANRQTKTKRILQETFHEVTHNEPTIVGHTRQKFGEKRAAAQEVAIALSKARKRGARIKAPKGLRHYAG